MAVSSRRSASGVRRERLALDVELALEELALGLHREVLAGGHRERAGHQAGHAGQPDHRPPGWAPATPRISETLVTSPSLMPNTAARAPPDADVAVVVDLGTASARSRPPGTSPRA